MSLKESSEKFHNAVMDLFYSIVPILKIDSIVEWLDKLIKPRSK